MSPDILIFLALGLPLIGAAGIAAAGAIPNLREGVTLATAVALLYVVIQMFGLVLEGQPAIAALSEPFPGVVIGFVVEPLGMLFSLVASGLWIVNSIYSIGYMRGNNEPRQTPFFICFAVAISAAQGIAFAGNLLTLFLFYEILTLSTYPLVTHKGNADAKAGGRTYLVLLIGTSMLLLLPAIIWVGVVSGTTNFAQGGILAGAGVSVLGLTIAYTVFVYGIGKAALMPFHAWLPAAMVAPTPVSALLHAVAVVKAGVFCVVKITVYIFGIDLLQETGASQLVAYLAGGTVVLASLIALNQDNLKKRLAFSTVSQLSYVIMAAAIATPVAIVGAALHIAAHAVSKITLFFGAGCIYTGAHLTEVSQLDGIGRRQPVTLIAFLIGAVSIIGLPPLIGVWSKWWIGTGAAESGDYWAVAVLMVSSLLNVAYLLPIVSRGFFVEPKDGTAGWKEAPTTCLIAISTTALLCVVLFFAADDLATFLSRIVADPNVATEAAAVSGAADDN